MALLVFLSLALSIASREFEGTVSSIVVALFIEIKTKSGLAVDMEMLVGMVVGGESPALRPGRSAYSLNWEGTSCWTEETRQLSTELCL